MEEQYSDNRVAAQLSNWPASETMQRSVVISPPTDSDESDETTDESNPDASFASAARPPPVFGPEPPPEYGPVPPPGLIARLRREEARAARAASSETRGHSRHETALPAVEAEKETIVKFAADTLFPERTWSRSGDETADYRAGVADPRSVRAAEGYADERLRKRSIRAHYHLAVMRAKLWNRDAYDRGGDTFL